MRAIKKNQAYPDPLPSLPTTLTPAQASIGPEDQHNEEYTGFADTEDVVGSGSGGKAGPLALSNEAEASRARIRARTRAAQAQADENEEDPRARARARAQAAIFKIAEGVSDLVDLFL